jgi:hypothetical protein
MSDTAPRLDLDKKDEDSPEDESLQSDGHDEHCRRSHLRWTRVVAVLTFLPALFALHSAYMTVTDTRLRIDSDATAPGGQKIERGIVAFDGAWWEHALMATPYLVMALGTVMVCRALVRIDVNMVMHSRPFTRRDSQVLYAAPFYVMGADLLASLTTAYLPRLLPGTEGLDDPKLDTGSVFGGFWIVTLMLVLFQMHRIHTQARTAHERLEEVA